MSDMYYDIAFDYDVADQWHLCAPYDAQGQELLGTEFKRGKPWDLSSMVYSRVYSCGRSVDFSLGGRATYFVRDWVMDLLRTIISAERLQGVPVEIEGVAERYEILNCLDLVDCLDTKRSDLSWWTSEDGIPSRIGTYDVNVLRLDPEKAAGHDLFRVKTWPVALVCSAKIRDLLIANGVTGIQFQPVG